MFSTGNVTVYVSNLDSAIRFYTTQLGLRLTNRFGDRWATVDAGSSFWTSREGLAGLVIGLRPASPLYPQPGSTGGVGYGIEAYAPVEDVGANLRSRGVRVTGEIIRYEGGNCFSFADLDGVRSYVNQFPPEMLSEEERDEAYHQHARTGLPSGGHAIVYVSDMDAAIRFYTETLGLKLTNRFDNHFATVEVGRSLVLAIHPQTPNTPVPGTKGSVTLGLVVDEPLDAVISRLAQRGVRTTGRSESDRSVDIEDLECNVITVWDARALTAESDLAAPVVSAVNGR
jgi:catechol 2,3-dioxygenase-like lactoylglutathione lyase family enzyme